MSAPVNERGERISIAFNPTEGQLKDLRRLLDTGKYGAHMAAVLSKTVDAGLALFFASLESEEDEDETE